MGLRSPGIHPSLNPSTLAAKSPLSVATVRLPSGAPSILPEYAVPLSSEMKNSFIGSHLIDLALVYDDFACEIGCDVDFLLSIPLIFPTIFEPLLVTITSPKLFLDMVRRTASGLGYLPHYG